jgi:hypothetical protein
MISGDEWREAFLWGLATGIPVGAVLAWLLWWIEFRTGQVRDLRGKEYPPDHSVPVPARRLTSQEIVDRAAAGVHPREFDPPCICGTVFLINGPCQAKEHVSAEAIAQRSAPSFSFCGFPVPSAGQWRPVITDGLGRTLIPCGEIATEGCAYCEKHAQWPKP